MKDHFRVTTTEGFKFSFIPPHADQDSALMAIYNGNWVATSTFLPSDVVALTLLHRAIGSIIEAYQPGVVSPLPDGDPSEVDAMKVLHEVDRLWREGNAE